MAHLSRLTKTANRRAEARSVKNLLLKTPGNQKVFKHRELWFFANRGIIRTIDMKTDEYRAVNPFDWVARTSAFNMQADHCRKKGQFEEFRRMTKLVEDMYTCYQMAIQQGNPFDSRVMPMKKATPGRTMPGNPRLIAEKSAPGSTLRPTVKADKPKVDIVLPSRAAIGAAKELRA